MTHEEFARRAQGRLEAEADRLEGEARDLGLHGEASKTKARAGELRVAALLVREEAVKAKAEERRRPDAGAPPLEAQG
jgi:hypothetical protein